jgi:hypothetical protein
MNGQAPRIKGMTQKGLFVYEELEQVFNHIAKYLMKILLGNFKTKLLREGIFKLTTWNES